MTTSLPFPYKSEDDFQKAIVQALEVYKSMGRLDFFHVPNGGRRNPREAKKLKAMGTRPGVADLVIIAPSRYTEFWEVKMPVKGRVSDSQRIFQTTVEGFGYPYRIIDSLNLVHIYAKEIMRRTQK